MPDLLIKKRKEAKIIDLNCDMGEGVPGNKYGYDREIMPFISSCNLSCGAHAGDPDSIIETLCAALHHNVKIGAHPGYPDRENFGRVSMDMEILILKRHMLFQVLSLYALVNLKNKGLTHLKPHGALYHDMAKDGDKAMILARLALQLGNGKTGIFGPAGSVLEKICTEHKVPFSAEFFADRNYTAEGTLVSRTQPDALVNDPGEVAERTLRFVRTGQVVATDGSLLQVRGETICLHGDHPAAVENAEKTYKLLTENGFKVG